MGKKLVLLTVIVLLLIGIPVTIYFLQKQQNVTTQAQKATTLTFSPGSVTKNPGDTFTSDINLNPGTNLVSFVRLDITYDPNTIDVTDANAIVKNAGAFPQTLEGPIVEPGHIAVTYSIGSDPTAAIQAPTKVATITFNVKSTAASGNSNISFSSNTAVYSIGSSDSANENVLLSADPLQVTVAGATSLSPTPTGTSSNPTATPTNPPAPTATRTPIPTATSAPTPTTVSSNPTATPTIIASNNPTATPTPGSSNSSPTATPTSTLIAQANTPTPTATSSTNQTSNAASTPTPTLAATGPGTVYVSLGVILGIVIIVGGFLFFAL